MKYKGEMPMTSNKKKKALTQYKSELHAISPLPLDVIGERLERIGDKQVAVQLQLVDDDTLAFDMQHIRAERMNAQVFGTVQRWQGTYSRLDADSTFHVPLLWLNYVFTVGLFLVLIAASLGLWFFLFGGFYYSFPWEIALPVSILMAVGGMRVMPSIELFRSEQYQALKDVDFMMQEIANALSDSMPDAQPVLEFDGSEDALALLLNTYPKQVRIGNDGELS
jgi:hypothetical protein